MSDLERLRAWGRRADRETAVRLYQARDERGAVAVLLSEIRAATGWTQDELGERLAISGMTVYRYEHGLSTPHGNRLRSIRELYAEVTRQPSALQEHLAHVEQLRVDARRGAFTAAEIAELGLAVHGALGDLLRPGEAWQEAA